MKRNILQFNFLFLLLLAACSPVRILNTEATDNFTLANYKTFDFYEVETGGSAKLTGFADQLDFIKAEVTRQLESRGLTHSNEAPDLAINIGVVVTEEVQTRQTDIRSDPPTYIGQRRYTWRSKEVEVGRYNEGTLSLHLVDRNKEALVWRGEAESVVPGRLAKLEKRISEGVSRLVRKIP